MVLFNDDVEKSIESFCKLGNEGTRQTDELILQLMMEKESALKGSI
jgi:L-cysteine desulfidase